MIQSLVAIIKGKCAHIMGKDASCVLGSMSCVASSSSKLVGELHASGFKRFAAVSYTQMTQELIRQTAHLVGQ